MKRDFRWKVFGQNRNPGSEIPSELRYSSSFGFTVMIGESLHRLLLTRLDRMSHQPQLIFMWVFFPRSLIGNETKQSLTPESFQMLLSGTRPSCLILVDKKFYCTIWGENSHWGFLCKWKRRSRRHYRVFMSVLYHDHIRIWKCWFFRGEPENPEPQSKVINQQQTKPTYDIRLELNPATMARGECSHYCASPAARIESF